MKMHEKEGLGHLPSEENLIKAEKSLRKRLGVREKFWEVKGPERSSEMRAKSRGPFIYMLSNSRQIERCQEVSSFKGFDRCSYRIGVQGKKKLDGSRIC